MATNALATPSRPIDDDPQAPPIPTVFVGDPVDGSGRNMKADPGMFGLPVEVSDWVQAEVSVGWRVILPLGRLRATTSTRSNAAFGSRRVQK
jgi:hypothetical protein